MIEPPDRPAVESSRRESPPGLLTAYYELTKPGIAGFVAITAGVSYFVAAQGRPALLPTLAVLMGTGLATGGALALNQYVEREVDGRMKRTRNRPLPSGRLTPPQALTFGIMLLVAGVVALGLTVGLVPSAITLVSAGAYIGIYTPLKSRSYLATLAGAVPGALPGLIGWSAATGGVELGGWVLFGIYFLWQLPHVLALAWLLREDYQRVGFFLAPPTDPDGRRIGRHMVYHSVSLFLLSLTPTALGMTGSVYLGGAAILSAGMLGVAWLASRQMSMRRVRQVFLGSILYQPVLLLLFLLDTLPPPP
jgi:protoheme IX farnesyltransferase